LQFRQGSKNLSKYICLTTTTVLLPAAIFLQNKHVQNYPPWTD